MEPLPSPHFFVPQMHPSLVLVKQQGPRWQRFKGSESIAAIFSSFSGGFGYMRCFFFMIGLGFEFDGSADGMSSAQRGRIGALPWELPTIERQQLRPDRARPDRQTHDFFVLVPTRGTSVVRIVDSPSNRAPYGRMERPTGAAPHHPRPTGAPHTLMHISRSSQLLPDGGPLALPHDIKSVVWLGQLR